LHGSLFESRSTIDETLIYPIQGWQLNPGDTCEKGSQLRPNIVWFGELVTMIEVAAQYAAAADIFLLVGTSLVVYPAAGLVHYVRHDVPKFVVDPKLPDVGSIPYVTTVAEKAGVGMEIVRKKLLELL
jgi:NAD-dependent deacetylase